MKSLIIGLFGGLPMIAFAQTITVRDSKNYEAVPFATISFGNGLGNFADEDGTFEFTQEKYADVDTLFVSAMGYTEKAVPTIALTETITLVAAVAQLNEVIVSAPKEGKFSVQKEKHITHSNVFASWLPTVESEVAVLFERHEGRPTQISKLLLPIYAENEYDSKGKGNFPTLFRVQYYENNGGTPGVALGYESVVFAINEKADKFYSLDMLQQAIYIPETGLFISLQVLGYANAQGKLAATKKYREVKTARGVQKISTSFRPLWPFTDKLPNRITYVRRVFLNNKKWQVFDATYDPKSGLIRSGNRNYGMGAEFKVWEE